jgi:hypothetical protein
MRPWALLGVNMPPRIPLVGAPVSGTVEPLEVKEGRVNVIARTARINERAKSNVVDEMVL